MKTAIRNIILAPPWTPRRIATSLWLDAADASTMTVSGGLVSQLTDKSGNSRNATATGTQRPTLVIAGQNGRNYLAFDALTNLMDIAAASIFTSGNANFTFVAAYKTGASLPLLGSIFANFTTGNLQILFGNFGAYTNPWGIYLNANLDIDPDDNIAINTNYIIGAVRNSGQITGYTNGIKKNTVANSQSVYAGAGTQSVWRIGANTSGTERQAFNLYELICVDGALSAATINQLTNYIKRKWKI